MSKKQSLDFKSKFVDVESIVADRLPALLEKNKSGALINISIDNLAMIISSQGGKQTDLIIDDVILEIQKIIGKNNIVVRSGKEHIHAFLSDSTQEKVADICESIYKAIQSFGCKESAVPIYFSATIGSVDFPKTAKTAEDIVDKAYVAVFDAKEKMMHYMAYSDSKKHTIEATNKLVLANYFQDAMINKKLRLAYQPIVNTKSGNVAYYECLLRITNPNGSTISAGPFIPIAEKMGFIDLIDSLVLQMVLEELRLSPELVLSANMSNVTIQDPKWLNLMLKLLDDKAVASRLIIEIIETSEQFDTKQVLRFINTVRELGCQIALDDFGTGYTSFSQLKQLPVDIIKIDGSFVKDIVYNPESKFFVKTLLEFSENFGLKAVAEFVENGEIAETLAQMNIDYMQGNYFSPAVNYRSWLGG